MPLVGMNNEEILASVGVSDEEIKELYKAGTIKRELDMRGKEIYVPED